MRDRTEQLAQRGILGHTLGIPAAVDDQNPLAGPAAVFLKPFQHRQRGSAAAHPDISFVRNDGKPCARGKKAFSGLYLFFEAFRLVRIGCGENHIVPDRKRPAANGSEIVIPGILV